MEETKKFEKQKDGSVHITVFNNSELKLPKDGEQVTIGKYNQTTLQMVDKKSVIVLKEFIEAEYKKGEDQMKQLNQQLEQLKLVDKDLIPQDLIKPLTYSLTKGSKAFKKEMVHLNKYIQDSQKKHQITYQIEYMEKQMKQVKSDLDEINKCL